jgi:2-polyprenyl-3-methyl-5-hydroxy-6-metoxy-1,4-benzoquinol methylase
MDAHTKEPQYDRCLELARHRLTTFGPMSNQVWHDDPKRLGFVLARYKFVAKMFSGMNQVLEVGCADAFGTRVVCQEVKKVVATDFDPVFVADVNARKDPDWPFECLVHDMMSGPLDHSFDGVYAVDVLEHILPADEHHFIANLAGSLNPQGVCLVGSPSLHSQAYASPPSKAGHVNCKDAPGLRATMSRQFHNVFIFSMNDEIVHTGFSPLAHYLWALCCNRKSP